jgi:4-oxalocrotonate tautomerase
MPLVRITVVQGDLSANQKRQIVEGVTEVLVAVHDEAVRAATWVMVDEVAGGDWGVGGHLLGADGTRATAVGATA